ncbi:MAG: glycine--tRNA ligase subunit beta [candidate division WOR-3 bacterium]|nr:glycine--tRNA ligase subunit beta [candidate division WOR-3 bacterium]MDH5683047.1 glycine--tRNA ligase subunit beta [candidate division WOR-3 bacterium]
MKKSNVLLLEIGTEELPPSFVEPAAQGFKAAVCNFLSKQKIRFGKTKIFYTPRRLAVLIQRVAAKQDKQIVEVSGPPWRSAFDQDGKPLRSALAFAQSQGKTVDDLYPKKTDRGEYAFLKKETTQEKTQSLLVKALPEIIQSIPFAKTMRWSEGKIRFGRPIRWICALFGKNPIVFKIDGLVASPNTFGHRNLTAKPIKLKTALDYEKILRRHGVIADPIQRRSAVEKKLKHIAQKINGYLTKDEELISEAVNTIEYPDPILCQFKPEFLSLPSVILMTALKYHQRCFSIQNKIGKLRPFFITVSNNPGCNQALVKSWYEKAVESRLKDALFYLQEDFKKGLAPLIETQKTVTWIEGLGNLYEKTRRLIELSKFITQSVPGIEVELLVRAAELAKVDLLTNMIREKEFASLQGTIGGIYAEATGEPLPVANAIREHYQPKSQFDSLPRSKEGGLLSIIDKIDNIVASFIIGAIPSGSEDPFALRRQASGILAIITEKGFQFDLAALLSQDLKLYEQAGYEALVRTDRTQILLKLHQFFKERLASLFLDRKLRYDAANAVLEVCWVNPVDAWQRAIALEEFRSGKDFRDLVIGQKRVANILKGQEITGPIKEQLLIEKDERELLNKAREIEQPLKEAIKQQNYSEALKLLLSLRKKIDDLFDNVLIMTGDINLRQNRLALLDYLKSLFTKVADLSQIVLEGE